MTDETKIRFPRYLSKEARTWWKRLSAEYEGDLSDPASQLLLETAFSSFDRWQQAIKTLKREGSIVKDRFGQKRAHPCIAVERDSKAMMISALRQLRLDLEPLNVRPGRPPGR